jgi:hypothetical protein
MQRQILDGVPYFTDKLNKVYLWDTEGTPTYAGTLNPKTKSVAFQPNLLTTLNDRLIAWRATQSARPRKLAEKKATKRRGHSSKDDGDANENSDDEQ